MVSNRGALGIVLNFPAVSFIRLDAGKTEERHRDVVRAGFADPGKTEGRRGRAVAGDEIAVVRAAVFLDQTHPHARVMLERRHLIWIDRVAQETGNHDG